jgi:serine/threonine protein phosphatase PrpC
MKNIFARLFDLFAGQKETYEAPNAPESVAEQPEKGELPVDINDKAEMIETDEQGGTPEQDEKVGTPETDEPAETIYIAEDDGTVGKRANPFPTITDAQTYTHQGKREYQEDNRHAATNFLIVSDGMGGHAKGDVASQIVVETLIQQLGQFSEIDADTPQQIEERLQIVIQNIITALNDYAVKEPMAYKMGATLAMVLLVEKTVYAIHIGDSRVYLFDKSGEIKFVSKDHSFVQELVDAGVITPEKALEHPRRNVITRVLQAKEGLRVKATVNVLDNITTGDKLLICSDGVLEAWKDDGLSVIFGQNFDNAYLVNEIQRHCAKRSSDNNTAIVATLNL